MGETAGKPQCDASSAPGAVSSREASPCAACHCCGEPLEPINVATCNGCGRRYHLVMRTDLPGRDCGSVWIDDQLQALEFGCNVCLGRNLSQRQPALRRYARHAGSARALVAARAGRHRVEK